jgi:hypothetical protein
VSAPSLQVKAVAGVRQPVDLCHYALYKICFASHYSIVVSSKVWSGSKSVIGECSVSWRSGVSRYNRLYNRTILDNIRRRAGFPHNLVDYRSDHAGIRPRSAPFYFAFHIRRARLSAFPGILRSLLGLGDMLLEPSGRDPLLEQLVQIGRVSTSNLGNQKVAQDERDGSRDHVEKPGLIAPSVSCRWSVDHVRDRGVPGETPDDTESRGDTGGRCS